MSLGRIRAVFGFERTSDLSWQILCQNLTVNIQCAVTFVLVYRFIARKLWEFHEMERSSACTDRTLQVLCLPAIHLQSTDSRYYCCTYIKTRFANGVIGEYNVINNYYTQVHRVTFCTVVRTQWCNQWPPRGTLGIWRRLKFIFE